MLEVVVATIVVVLSMSVENAQLEDVKSPEAPQVVRGGASRSPFHN